MNRSLVIGACGVLIILLAILFGPLLAPYDMDHLGVFKKMPQPDGTVKMMPAPFPPSQDYLLGSDLNGRDTLSILLRGARITVTFAVAVALMRLVLGLPLAYLANIFPRTVGWLIEKLSLAFTTIPAVMFVALLAGIFNITDAITPGVKLIMLILLVTLVGVFPTAHVLQKKMETILQSPFMEGQSAIGAGKWRILRKHLLPHLSSYTMVLFVSEIAQVLWLVTQLGFLYIFVGGAREQDHELPSMQWSEEWAGAAATSIRALQTHTMVVLYPILALSLAIFSFNLLGEGLRKRNDRKWGILE
jgi:peptide/nickel transport system permease protein